MKYFLILFSVVVLSSCAKETIKPSSVIPSQVNEEYERFFNEGHIRDIKVNRKFVKIILTNNSFKYSGLCSYSDQTIYLDTTSINYLSYKEQLIFHEMGHYFLNRPHRDGSFNNADHDIISIMNTSGLINYSGAFSYKRQYYIDELFNENTPTPDWVKSN